jgi:hypothetical protein
MNLIERTARSRSMWLMLSMLAGLALAQPAHAQYGGQQGVRGPMWACRTSQFGGIVTSNALKGHRVKTHMFSPFLGVFLFSMQEKNGAPSKKCYVPTYMVAPVVQINNSVQVGVAIGGNVELYNTQTNVYTAPTTWYFCAPSWAAGPIVQQNNSVQKAFALGGNVVMQSDQVNVAAPASAGQPIVQMNNSVQVGVAIGGNVTLSSTQTNAIG